MGGRAGLPGRMMIACWRWRLRGRCGRAQRGNYKSQELEPQGTQRNTGETGWRLGRGGVPSTPTGTRMSVGSAQWGRDKSQKLEPQGTQRNTGETGWRLGRGGVPSGSLGQALRLRLRSG